MLFLFLLLLYVYIYIKNNIQIKLLHNDVHKYNNKIKTFEINMKQWYPFGNDMFRISHGNNYFAFFKRQGDLYILVAMNNNEVVGTIFGILKNNVWYLADVKINKKYRGHKLCFRMGLHAIHLLKKTNKVYGILMDKNGQNILIKYVKQMPIITLTYSGKLYIYALNYNQLLKALSILKKNYNKIGVVFLDGVKDLILKSTNKKIKVCHVQFNKVQNCLINTFLKSKDVYQTYTYMFCVYETHNIVKQLRKIQITTNITSSII